MDGMKGIRLNKPQKDVESIMLFFWWYLTAISQQEMKYLPDLVSRVLWRLTLPVYADLTLEDVDRICEIILECGK